MAALPLATAGCAEMNPFSAPTPKPTRPTQIIQPGGVGFGFGGDRLRQLSSRVPSSLGLTFEMNNADAGPPNDPERPRKYAEIIDVMAASRGADIVAVEPALLPALGKAGVLTDLNSLLRGEKWFRSEEFWPSTLRAGSFKGRQLAIPIQLSVNVLMYNPKRFLDDGAPLPSTQWTWNDARAAARLLTKPGPRGAAGQWGFLVTPMGPNFLELAWQNGALVISDDASRIDLTEDGTIKALELLSDMVGRDEVAPPLDADVLRGNYANFGRQLRNRLGSGEIAMTVLPVGGQHWWRGSGVELEISDVPRGVQPATFGSVGLMLGVPSRARDVQLSLDSLKALSDASVDLVWVPARRNRVNLRKAEVLMSENDEFTLLSSLNNLRVLPGDFPPEVGEVVLKELLAPVLSGEKRPLQAARHAQLLVQSALSRARG
jgi:hypothetical protein